MHKVLKRFPCSFDGIRSEMLSPGDERDFGSMADGLVKAGLIGETDGGAKTKGKTGLRDDGPTIAEFVSAGYAASAYPPKGYASRSTPEEIAAAVKAEEEAKAKAEAEKAAQDTAAELAKQTVAQLKEIAATEKVELAADDAKDAIIAKIVAVRAAAAQTGAGE